MKKGTKPAQKNSKRKIEAQKEQKVAKKGTLKSKVNAIKK